jgi:hypothetical protein
MTLPFENTNEKERQYVCFVCARGFKCPEEYRNHIIEKHQEGREYVKCPLERCGYPVRDIKSHFAVCHKNEPLPKGCQMKAMIWRDVRDPGGRKKRKIAFKDGDFVSKKNNRKIHYRSGYELQVYECLEKMNSVKGFAAEPFGIPYLFKGEQKTYFPDLLVEFADGTVEVWEVKPQSQTTYDINDAKWTAADIYCQKRGWRFEVKTEKGIRLLKEGLR